MKNLLVGSMAIIGFALLVWALYRFFSTSNEDIIQGCIKVNRNKFSARWADASPPGGTMQQIADKYLDSDGVHEDASIAGGFFRSIDVYPSMNAAQYYQKQLKAYYHSNNGLPWWNIETGENLCKN